MRLNPPSPNHPVYQVVDLYVKSLFRQFVLQDATAADFSRLLEVEPGSITELAHACVCTRTTAEILEDLCIVPNKSERNEAARQVYNLCILASRRRIDPQLWPQPSPPAVKRQGGGSKCPTS